MPYNFVPINLRVVIFDNLGDGGYSVFCSVDVLYGARVWLGDDGREQRQGARAGRRELLAPELRQHSAAVGRRLAHLRLAGLQRAQYRLEEYVLVFDASGTCRQTFLC